MELRGLPAWLRPYAQWCLDVARHYGVPVHVTSVVRTWEEQQRLRDRWERGLSRFPANMPGDSAHNYGLAWDSVVPDEYQAWWNDVRRSVGWEVLDNDVIHAQVPGWRGLIE